MSYNDPTDVQATLERAATPPAASPSGVAVLPPSSPPAPIQKQRAASGASAQLVPVSPVQPPIIAPTTQTPLSVDGQGATPQTPATTQPGVLTQS